MIKTKKKQNQCQNAACEQKTSEKWKFGSNKKLGLERTMNGSGKPLKNPIQRIEIKSEKISFGKSTRFLAPLPVSA